ncbi:hypothetical protein MRS44_017732 [Fusarium solani]|uniref:uncharacterized protein n=1 Tax=Fusarium solani TaxID=169388 RepID=UPI0032C4A1D5|nr:hypothetical protein MRS44_017732 [Fusarium solani]
MRGLDQSLRELPSTPLSSQDLSQWQRAVERVLRYYPSWNPLGEKQPVYDHLVAQDQTSSDCATKVRELVHIEDDIITPSRRCLAQTGNISMADILAYLELLRKSNIGVDITTAIPRRELDSVVGGLDREKTWIVPVHDELGWAFAAVYPDGIHKYNMSDPRSETGPSAWPRSPSWDTEDAGVIMLLDIRLIANGFAHVADEVLNDKLPHFRNRLLVELICGQLDPDEPTVAAAAKHVTSLLGSEQQVDSEYFLAALGDRLEQSYEVPLDHSLQSAEPQAASAINGNIDRPVESSTSNASDHISFSIATSAPGAPVSRGKKKSQRRRRPPRRSPASETLPPTQSNDFNNILEILSSAVIVARSVGASSKTEMHALCSVIETTAQPSDFHHRFCKANLYDQVATETIEGYDIDPRRLREYKGYIEKIRNAQVHESEVKAIEDECRLWMGLRKWCESQKIYEYTLLCAIPKGHPFSVCTLTQLQTRLYDDHDPLRYLLMDTQKLCQKIIDGSLPSHLLCVEVYPSKQKEVFCRDAFAAYTSVETNPLIPIRPAPPSSFSRTRKRIRKRL